MKKNRMIIASIVGLIGIGIIGTLLYGPINKADNEYVSVSSVIYNIKDNTIMDKEALLRVQDKENTIQVDKIIEKMEKEDYTDESKLNDYVKQIDMLNVEIDNMIDIYNKDEDMKKDVGITQAMMDIEGLNNLIDSLMDEYNTVFAPSFNMQIKKFPVNIVAKSKGWFEVDKFSSID
ncbi:MAG: LemA family protein [Paraclostridium sp.]|uniref:LemA family protein n=1 Tax=Paraclostridium sp. TaxID=2023273 RepID=UPI003F302FAF